MAARAVTSFNSNGRRFRGRAGFIKYKSRRREIEAALLTLKP
jgi:hypothetical protein